MQTEVTELPESRVRIDVAVDPADVEAGIEHAAEALGRQMRVPGFRKGKVPPAMVIQRAGRATVIQEALQHSLPGWYERALLDSGVNAVGDPELRIGEMPEQGEPLGFSIEVAVRPPAKLGDYKGLEVGRAEPEVPEDAVDGELERLRESFASLEGVERPAAEGDFALIDYRGEIDGEPFEGGEARDFLVELGARQVLEEFDVALAGASAGDEVEVEVGFPDDYSPESLAGKRAKFSVTVKEIREKKLPELDDDFAADASEFDSLAELREDLGGRIRHLLEHRAEDAFREAALDAAVDAATVEAPDAVVTARAEESWQRLERSLAAQNVSPDRYLELQGKTREELISEAKPDAERSLKREAVLEAIAEAEAIEVSDDEMLDALRPAAEREGGRPEPTLERLRATGRDALLRDDLRMRKALDVLVEHAKPIALEQAEAREKLWTPEKEREAAGGLWTPDRDDG